MQTTHDRKTEEKLGKGGHPRLTNWKNPVAVIRDAHMRMCQSTSKAPVESDRSESLVLLVL
jgi:hypothetical protein